MQKTRTYIKILKEICEENGFVFNSYSDGWLIRIDNGDKRMFIHGYKFPNNSASISELCTDKSSLSEYLSSVGIPCIPHWFFDNVSKDNLFAATELLKKYGSLVVKPNDGTGGRNVWRVSTVDELFTKMNEALSKNGNLCVSPFVSVDAEFRTVIYKDRPLFTFEKIRPSVVADGKTSYREYLKNAGVKNIEIEFDFIPKEGETLLLTWKHNLQGGAKPLLIVNPASEILDICKRIHSVSGVSFASVDIVETNGRYYVLEVNSGVMIEHFASFSGENYELAKNAYSIAIKDYFENYDV